MKRATTKPPSPKTVRGEFSGHIYEIWPSGVVILDSRLREDVRQWNAEWSALDTLETATRDFVHGRRTKIKRDVAWTRDRIFKELKLDENQFALDRNFTRLDPEPNDGATELASWGKWGG